MPVLAFSLVVAAATAMLFGLLPAFQTAKRDIVEPLKDSGKGVSGGFRGGKLRGALVIVEVALSLMLLAGAGLLMRSFVRLQTVDLGMNPNNVLVARLPLPRGQYTTAAEKQRFFRELLRRLHEVPEIEVATAMNAHLIQASDHQSRELGDEPEVPMLPPPPAAPPVQRRSPPPRARRSASRSTRR